MAKQARGERTRNALVRAAAEVFDRAGYERANLTTISEAAGVTKGALSFHFAHKEELARAVQELACAHSRTAFEGLNGRDTTAVQTLIDITHALTEQLRGSATVRAGLRLSGERADADPALDCSRIWLDAMCQALQHDRADRSIAPGADTPAVAALALAMTTGMEVLVRGNGSVPPSGQRPGAHSPARQWLTRFWTLLLPQVASLDHLHALLPGGSLLVTAGSDPGARSTPPYPGEWYEPTPVESVRGAPWWRSAPNAP